MSQKSICMFTSGLIAGLALGTAAGILLAPESGDDTRNRISDTVSDTYYDAYDKFVAMTDKLSAQFEEWKATVADQVAQWKGEAPVEVEEAFEAVDEDVAAEAADEPEVADEPEAEAEEEIPEEDVEAEA